jgi:hypothetical protein
MSYSAEISATWKQCRLYLLRAKGTDDVNDLPAGELLDLLLRDAVLPQDRLHKYYG